MHVLIIRPSTHTSWNSVKRKDVDVGKTHEIHAEYFNTVIYDKVSEKVSFREFIDVPRCARTISGLSFVSDHSTFV